MIKSQARESTILDVNICEKRFECPICLSCLKDPIVTNCGHRFCKSCINSWLEKGEACPVDNIKLSIESDIFPDNYTRREIATQKVPCTYAYMGCPTILSLLDVDNHVSVCAYKLKDSFPQRCDYYDVGCTGNFSNAEEQETHMTQNTNLHLQLLFKEYKETKLKINVAGKSQETNFWDPPSKNDSSTSDSNEPIENLLKNLFEKIVVLEQKNHEQKIIISNMSDQITALNTAINDTIPLKYCNGTYIWTLNDFKSKLDYMFEDNRQMYYSPGFYTSPNGYKLCVRMNLSPYDPTYIALIVHFMKTENDICLDWPVQGKITITIIHPSAPKMNLKEILITKPNLEAFNKPSQIINPKGFGYTEFASVEELLTQGYIVDSKLNIKIQIIIT